jgi:hypothetical protein
METLGVSKRSRTAGVIVAAAVFVLTLVKPADTMPLPLLSAPPPMVAAAIWAVLAFIWVWFMEGVLIAVGAIWRRVIRFAGWQ